MLQCMTAWATDLLTLLSREADRVPLVAVVSCSLICPSTPRTCASSASACASLAASVSLFLGVPVTVPSLLLASTFTCSPVQVRYCKKRCDVTI